MTDSFRYQLIKNVFKIKYDIPILLKFFNYKMELELNQ